MSSILIAGVHNKSHDYHAVTVHEIRGTAWSCFASITILTTIYKEL